MYNYFGKCVVMCYNVTMIIPVYIGISVVTGILAETVVTMVTDCRERNAWNMLNLPIYSKISPQIQVYTARFE